MWVEGFPDRAVADNVRPPVVLPSLRHPREAEEVARRPVWPRLRSPDPPRALPVRIQFERRRFIP